MKLIPIALLAIPFLVPVNIPIFAAAWALSVLTVVASSALSDAAGKSTLGYSS